MEHIEALNKACDEAATEALALLRKSQMSFDFSAPHHVAYDRTNSSGTISHVAAKGYTVKTNTGRKASWTVIDPDGKRLRTYSKRDHAMTAANSNNRMFGHDLINNTDEAPTIGNPDKGRITHADFVRKVSNAIQNDASNPHRTAKEVLDAHNAPDSFDPKKIARDAMKYNSDYYGQRFAGIDKDGKPQR